MRDACMLANNRNVYAYGGGKMLHRAVADLVYGPVPKGYDVHHMCDNRACYNPRHLAVLTRREHARLHKTVRFCPQGHDIDVVGRTGRRQCKECSRGWRRAYNQRKRDERSA